MNESQAHLALSPLEHKTFLCKTTTSCHHGPASLMIAPLYMTHRLSNFPFDRNYGPWRTEDYNDYFPPFKPTWIFLGIYFSPICL